MKLHTPNTADVCGNCGHEEIRHRMGPKGHCNDGHYIPGETGCTCEAFTPPADAPQAERDAVVKAAKNWYQAKDWSPEYPLFKIMADFALSQMSAEVRAGDG